MGIGVTSLTDTRRMSNNQGIKQSIVSVPVQELFAELMTQIALSSLGTRVYKELGHCATLLTSSDISGRDKSS